MIPERPHRMARSQPREVLELKKLKATHSELTLAIDLQIALVELQRRVQARLPTPWIDVDKRWLAEQQHQGRPLLQFKDLQVEWSDFRFMFRQTADILRRHDMMDYEDHARIQNLIREGHLIEALVVRWYTTKAFPGDPAPDPPVLDPPVNADALEHVLLFAMRPFLARCPDALMPQLDLSAWTHPYCPLCGGDPDMATLTVAGGRMLICGRCTAQWPFDAYTCPFCRNADRSQLTSFASRDERYRIDACNACRRYIKTYDPRRSDRPAFLSVDSVATLTLDAAVMQKGYVGG